MYPLDSIPSLQFQAWRSKSDIIFPCDTFDSYLDSDSLSPIALFLLLESKFAKALFENIDAGMRRAKRALDKGGRDEEDSSNHHLGTNQQDSDHESSQKLARTQPTNLRVTVEEEEEEKGSNVGDKVGQGQRRGGFDQCVP